LTFIETGISKVPDDKSITSIAEALINPKAAVHVYIQCYNKPCDFSKVDPIK